MDLILRNKNKEKIIGTLDSIGSKKLFFIIPGSGENRKQKPYKELSAFLNKNEFDTLRIDLSGMGESEGKKEENNITKNVKDFFVFFNAVKKNYNEFYFFGFSFGALLGLIANTKIKFEKSYLASTALFAESRPLEKEFLKAWKKLKTLPDYEQFKKGKIIPAKQKLNYAFVKELKKYKIKSISKKVKGNLVFICGAKEKEIKQQQTLLAKLTKSKEYKIKQTNHYLDTAYLNFVKTKLVD